MTHSRNSRNKRDQQIANGYRDGATVENIMKWTGTSRGTVYAVLKRLGVKLRRDKK